MTTFTWTSGAVSGDWSTTSDWNPSDGPPGASDSAVINAAGTYTVTITTSESVNAVTLNSANADLDLTAAGTLTLAGADATLTVDAGTLDLAGELIDGVVRDLGGDVIFESNVTLDGVTWDGPMVLTSGAGLNVMGGLTVATTSGGNPGSIDLTAGNISIYVNDSETLNNATINFGSIGGDFLGNFAPSGTLTLGTSLDFVVSGGFDQLVDDSFGGSIAALGSISVTGTGDLSVGGSFNNVGAINASNDGTVDFSGAALTNSGTMSVGGNGDAILGGVPLNTGQIIVAGGTLDLQTNSVTLDNSGTISVSSVGSIIGEVLPAATLLNNGDIALTSGGILNLSTTALTNLGTISVGTDGDAILGGTPSNTAYITVTGGTLDLQTNSTTLTNSGTISVSSVGSIIGEVLPAATFMNSGSVAISGGGILNLSTTTLTNSGTISVGTSGEVLLSKLGTNTGHLIIGSGGTMEFASGATDAVTFTGTGGELILSPASGTLSHSGTISGIAVGDTIFLQSTTFFSNGTTHISGHTLQVVENTTTVNLLFNSSLTGDQFQLSSNGGFTEVTLVCFATGTRIMTPDGEVPVERLAVGDLVLTHRGQARPVTWIGNGRTRAKRGRRNGATPVIVHKGALADNVPHSDLRVTKGHSFYIDGVLIPVEFLVNHRSIMWDDRAQDVDLYHIELASHDVLLANGAPAESYRDDGNRWLFRNVNDCWNGPPLEPFAPVLTGGPIVDAVWWRLLERSGPRPGFVFTDDPDFHLRVSGMRVDAKYSSGGKRIFSIPRERPSVRVVSRAGCPAELGLARDPRVLGVGLQHIVVRQGSRIRAMETDNPALVDGFHDFEPDIRLRWTDGDAELPTGLFEGFEGSTELELRAICMAQYPCFEGETR